MRVLGSFLILICFHLTSNGQLLEAEKEIKQRLYDYIEDTSFRNTNEVRDLLSKKSEFSRSTKSLLDYTTIVLNARETADQKGEKYRFEDYTPTLIKLLSIIEQWETEQDTKNLNFAYGNIARALYNIEVYEYSIIYFKRRLKLNLPDKHFVDDLYKLANSYLELDQEVQNSISIIRQYWNRIESHAGDEKDSILFEFNQLLIEANYKKKQFVESLTRLEQNIRYADRLSLDRKIEAYSDLAELKHKRHQKYSYLFEILTKKYGQTNPEAFLKIYEAEMLFALKNDVYDEIPDSLSIYVSDNSFNKRGMTYLLILKYVADVEFKNKKYRKAYRNYKEILTVYGPQILLKNKLEILGNIAYSALEIGKNKESAQYFRQYSEVKIIYDRMISEKAKNIQDLVYWFRNAKNAVEFSSKQMNIDLILEQKDSLYKVQEARMKTEGEAARRRTFNIAMVVIVGIVIIFLFYAYKANQKNDKLLQNILPAKIAKMLKSRDRILALKKNKTPSIIDEYKMATVLFTDFKGFTTIAETLEPEELVEELNQCFAKFDQISKRNNLEKIKTIGDAYMAAGGIPDENTTNPEDAVNAAIEMIDFIEEFNEERRAENKPEWQIRVGINTGHIVAGIIGRHKYSYDVWGDAVNLASRMESSGEPGRINISENTHTLVKDKFNCSYRGEVEAKNKGKVKMYFVEGKK